MRFIHLFWFHVVKPSWHLHRTWLVEHSVSSYSFNIDIFHVFHVCCINMRWHDVSSNSAKKWMSVFPKMLRVFKVCIIYVFVAHGQYNVDDVHGADQRYHLLHSGIRSHFNWYLTSDNVSLMLFCLLHVCTVNQRFSTHHKLPPSFFFMQTSLP